MSRINVLFVSAALAVSGCGITPNACEAEFADLCELCPKNDQNAALCKCLDEGELTKDDGPEGQWETNDEAQQYCDQARFALRYQGDDGRAECKADRAYLHAWGVDACEDLGFRD